LRARIAAAAARIMAEDGIDDFGLAKRKAARQLGVLDSRALPGNDEVEDELRAYRSIYQAGEQDARSAELLGVALDAMRALQRFNPYLTGAVLKGIAGPYSPIDLQLFPESAKEVELFFLDRGVVYETEEVRRFAGDRERAAVTLSVSWRDYPLRITVYDPRDERTSLKSSPLGKAMDRAGITEVSTLLEEAERRASDSE
jgi:hypothetical protein